MLRQQPRAASIGGAGCSTRTRRAPPMALPVITGQYTLTSAAPTLWCLLCEGMCCCCASCLLRECTAQVPLHVCAVKHRSLGVCGSRAGWCCDTPSGVRGDVTWGQLPGQLPGLVQRRAQQGAWCQKLPAFVGCD